MHGTPGLGAIGAVLQHTGEQRRMRKTAGSISGVREPEV